MPPVPYEPQHLHKMPPGWLFPYLVEGDALLGSGRWAYWSDTLLDLKLPAAPLPGIVFDAQPERETAKHIQQMLDHAMRYSGMRQSDVFEAFVAWLLHGFGDPEFRQYATPDLIPYQHLDLRTLDAWYTDFQLGRLQQHPADYMAFFAQGGDKGFNAYTGLGFFATPMPVCTLMAEMTFQGETRDTRKLSMYDPCCGTGSLLLAASNYSMNLYAQDISQTMVRCTKVNGYLYMPWAVWWPDFSQYGGPTPQQCRAALFGDAVPQIVPTPEATEASPPETVPDDAVQAITEALALLVEVALQCDPPEGEPGDDISDPVPGNEPDSEPEHTPTGQYCYR